MCPYRERPVAHRDSCLVCLKARVGALEALLAQTLAAIPGPHEGPCYWDCKPQCESRAQFREQAKELLG